MQLTTSTATTTGTEMRSRVQAACIILLLISCPAVPDSGGETQRTGFFKLEFTPLELLGEEGTRDAEEILRSDDELSWQLYVPDSYDPATPAGVVVYVSPQPKGGPPRSWSRALGDKNLIWIGANNAGNRVAVGKRMFLAMLAPRVLARNYVLDPERIYVAGFSGGGKTASRVSSAKPELFRGGIYIGGAEFWANMAPPRLDLIRKNYHVFLSGTSDFNELLTRRVYAAYKNAGIEHCELIVVRKMGHEMPRAKIFMQAIDYLDSRSATESDRT